MNDKVPEIKPTPKKAIQISIVPAFFASACCMTYPILIMLGFYVSESFFIENKWEIRTLGLLILLVSLCVYFWTSGIRSFTALKQNISEIFVMTLYTALAFALAYYALIYYFSPILCSSLNLNSCTL